MSYSIDVDQLLADALESGLTPEEACAEHPELLAELRLRWEEFRSLNEELDLHFPFPGSSGSAPPRSGPTHVPQIQGYEVGDVIGRGGMGVVYGAHHLVLNRPVALKMLLAGAYASPKELARFLREARIIAALTHPNLVHVYDFGETEGLPYYTMELVSGGTLAEKLDNVPQPSAAAADMLITLADAVAAAHDGGIVHRDLKPSNVLLTLSGIPKISDFGLSRSFTDADALTIGNVGAGTPSYMAPEQVSGPASAFGPPGDVYSLGVVLYEMLTGRPPFRGESAAETRRQLVADEPVRPSRLNPRVPRDLETICLKCLQKDPRRRYATARELGEDLQRFRRDEPILARTSGPVERAAKWVRRHPTVTTAMSAIAILTIAILGTTLWLLASRAATTRAAEQDLHEAVRDQQQSDWPDARAAIDRADVRLAGGGPRSVREDLERVRRASTFVAALDTMRQQTDRHNGAEISYCAPSSEYVAAFKALKLIDLDATPEHAAEAVRASDIRAALVGALEDWALSLTKPDLDASDSPRREWILSILKRLDADPTGWRDRALSVATWRDPAAIAQLVSTAPIENEPIPLLLATANRLTDAKADPVPFLVRVQQAYPADYWVNYVLGDAKRDQSNFQDAVRYYQAAVTARPGAATVRCNLGIALSEIGRTAEALWQLRKSVELDPDSWRLRSLLAWALSSAGQHADGRAVLKEAIQRFPGEPELQAALAANYADAGRDLEAERACRLALASDPRLSSAQNTLRGVLIRQGRSAEAFAVWKRAVEEHPDEWAVTDGYAEYCAYLNKPEEYERARNALLARMADSPNARQCEAAARPALLLAPSSEQQLRRATTAIDRAIALTANPEFAPYLAYFQFSKSLAEYRNGNMTGALQMAVASQDVLNPGPQLVAAMAEFRSGHEQEARATLAKATASFNWTATRSDQHEAWIYHVLRREADSLIEPKP